MFFAYSQIEGGGGETANPTHRAPRCSHTFDAETDHAPTCEDLDHQAVACQPREIMGNDIFGRKQSPVGREFLFDVEKNCVKLAQRGDGEVASSSAYSTVTSPALTSQDCDPNDSGSFHYLHPQPSSAYGRCRKREVD